MANRSELEQKLAHKYPNILRRDIDKIVDIILKEITEAICRNESVELRGVFRLSKKSKKPYLGRNPKTGAKVNVASKNSIKFKASKILLKKLNKSFTENKISDTY